MSQPTFNERWAIKAAVAFHEPPRFALLCPPALELADLYEALVQPVREQPSEITVNQVLLHLQDQFFAVNEKTKAHKHASNRAKGKYTCLLDVYRSYFRELRTLRWKVNPPLVREPPPMVEPKYEINGSFIGVKK